MSDDTDSSPPRPLAHKRQAIVFWVLTGLVILGEGASGIANVVGAAKPVNGLLALGYPTYLTMILGPLKLAGVLALAIPRTPRLKEWAYAGFVFKFVGAIASHVLNGDSVEQIAPAVVVMALLVGSYVLRPADRRPW